MKQDFKKILRDSGLKSTNPRLAVLKTLSEMKNPATTQEIHKKLKEKIDLVTLYRTLASFEKSELVKKINLNRDAICYELNKDHHHHIVCTNCNKIEDFENKEIEKALENIVRKSFEFKKVKEHSVELFGLCKVCA